MAYELVHCNGCGRPFTPGELRAVHMGGTAFDLCDRCYYPLPNERGPGGADRLAAENAAEDEAWLEAEALAQRENLP